MKPNFKDIKMIISDLDHTLLTEDSQVPSEFFDYYEKLKEAGVQFIVASGRPYQTIQEQFSPILDEITIISDNGALITEKKNVIFEDVLSSKDYQEIVNYSHGNTTFAPVLCRSGIGPSYVGAQFKDLEENLSHYFSSLDYFEDIETINAPIAKVSVYFPENNSHEGFKIFYRDRYSDDLMVVAADDNFVDIMNLGINKGEAISFLMDRYGIDPSQVIALGDSMNDKEMLEAVENSYTVANADPELVPYSKYQTESNENHGVLRVIEEVLRNKEHHN